MAKTRITTTQDPSKLAGWQSAGENQFILKRKIDSQDALHQYLFQRSQVLEKEAQERANLLKVHYRFLETIKKLQDTLREANEEQLTGLNNQAIKASIKEKLDKAISLYNQFKTSVGDLDEFSKNVVKPTKIARSIFEVGAKIAAAGLVVVGIDINTVIQNIVTPALLGLTGLLSYTQAGKNFKNILEKKKVRKNQHIRMMASLSTMATAFGTVCFLAIVGFNPLILGVAAISLGGLALIKQSIMSYRVKKEVNFLKNDFNLLQGLKADAIENPQGEDPITQSNRIEAFENQIIEMDDKIKAAEKDCFERQRKAIFSGFTILGSALLLAGLFFPPLIIPGAAILGGSAIIEIIDRKFDCKFSKEIRNFYIDIKSKIRDFFSSKKTHVRTTEADLGERLDNNVEANKTNEYPKIKSSTLILSNAFKIRPALAVVDETRPSTNEATTKAEHDLETIVSDLGIGGLIRQSANYSFKTRIQQNSRGQRVHEALPSDEQAAIVGALRGMTRS